MIKKYADGDLLYETRDHVAIVTLNRPKRRNALTTEMFAALEEVFDIIQADDQIYVAVLTGAGEKAFSAGADLEQFIPRFSEQGPSFLFPDPTKRFMSNVYKPIIAAVHGPCIAGGLEILLGTDIRIAAEDAIFGLGEVRWGLIPSGGSHVRLPRQVPWVVAMEMILGGQPINAERARESGLINEIVDSDKVLNRALEWAELICRSGPQAVQTAKEIAVRGMALETPFALESAMAEPVFKSEDAKEGPRAFMEKREPKFGG